MVNELLLTSLSQAAFGVTLSVGSYVLFHLASERIKSPLFNPYLFSVAAIIAFLSLSGIPYESYEQGGKVLSFFLGPAIVSLAVPLYRQLDQLKDKLLPILLGLMIGVLVSILGGVLLSLAFGMGRELTASMAPKGVTSAISMNLSTSYGGNAAATLAFVNVAGITGYVLGDKVQNLLGIRQPLARGLAFGTASHAMGTRKAMEEHPLSGAIASLAIGMAGILTSLLMPLLMPLLGFPQV